MNRREFVRASGAAVTAAFVGTPAFAEGKPIKIGYNVATLANPFFQGMTKGVVDASSKFPGMTYSTPTRMATPTLSRRWSSTLSTRASTR